ncbi:hypothetical protein GCM10010960_15970 [Arenimonas maotaiensis]|uniref:Curli production assembly/transport component CsgG n=1 Tax=Arenimonas maotaiensis TaxID=1446479 RepID=A0A917CQQ2_9GAMM|nr:CsgG/HfaB family protein [Arenimonas maotaiensis]GGF95055.1 hypothetical protein GCM10010960_15970 [Arenimonas maotaiensis]
MSNARVISQSALAFSAILVAGLSSAPVQGKQATAQETRAQQITEIPVCKKSLGSIAVIEPEDSTNWWSGQQLPAPSKLIKIYVNKSRCFTLVDRGAGFQAMQMERELAGGGELRGGSNIGKGQVKAADYVLVPDLISSNTDSGGSNIGGLLGGFVGGRAGALMGGVSFKKKTADVVLTVTDVRSSEQVAMAEGHAKKTDMAWGGGGGLFGSGGLGALGGGAYANTEIGQVIALAYLQAYHNLVQEMGGLPDNASAANVVQALRVVKPARLFTTPKGEKVVRTLDPGMMLYPTGNKSELMWEVEDELGNKGWVLSTLTELAK